MSETENNLKDCVPWSDRQIKLLITTRLRHESEFMSGKRKRKSLWSTVYNEIKEVDAGFPFSRDEIFRKFTNMFVTYKRIKKRNGESGRESTRWEYFTLFDETYGTKHFVSPPGNIQASTLGVEEDPGSDPETEIRNPPRRPRGNSDILDFLRQQEEHEERRHNDQIEVERQRINVLKDIKELLERCLSQ